MVSKIDINKSIPTERWGEFFDQFSDGNRGRSITIEVINDELGNQTLIENAALMAIVYDPPNKGNDLVIEVGQSEVSYAHTVDAPTEVLTGQNANGQIVALWISDATGTKTLIKLHSD
jgi:hypothetical protein